MTGVGEVIGALGLGMVSDYIGRRAPTFIAGSLVFLYGLYLCIPLYEAAKLVRERIHDCALSLLAAPSDPAILRTLALSLKKRGQSVSHGVNETEF